MDTINLSTVGGQVSVSAELSCNKVMVNTIEANPTVGVVSFASPVATASLNMASRAAVLDYTGVNAANVNVKNLVLPAPPAGSSGGYMRIDSSAGQLSLIGSPPMAQGQHHESTRTVCKDFRSRVRKV